MSRPVYTPDYLDHANRLRQQGLTLSEIAKQIGGKPDSISVAMRAAGMTIGLLHRTPPHAKKYPVDEMVRRYLDGESVKALGQRYNLNRRRIASDLLRNGVEPRGRGAAMRVRMDRSTPEERKALAQAANEACRGVPKTRAHRRAIARAECKRIGQGEEEFGAILRERGIAFAAQAPVDVYNIDFLIGTVAVELRCVTGDPLKTAGQRKRIEHFLSRGLAVLYVQFRDVEAFLAHAEDVIAYADEMGRDPSPVREYRMVWCGAEHFTRGRDERGQLTAVPSPVRYSHVVKASYRGVAW
jgi:hypothetical protein